jgi:hypothetical protein
VTSYPDGDTVVLRWSDDGTEHVIREGDEEAGARAFIKCVAEGLTRGDLIEGEAEQIVAVELLKEAQFVTILPTIDDATEFSLVKGGQVVGADNLIALQAIHDAVGAVINAEVRRRAQKPDDASDAENTPESGGTEDGEDTAVTNSLMYAVTKSVADQQYTFGPMYAPDQKDAHGEFTDADTLQKAVHEYVQACVDKGDNSLNRQHDTETEPAGRWVDVVSWPYETTITLKQHDGTQRDVTLPAGTIYMGIQWEDDVWPDVKKGNIAGLSMGGRAMRVASDAQLAEMGKAGMHRYAPSDGSGSDCAICGESYDEGNHYGQ